MRRPKSARAPAKARRKASPTKPLVPKKPLPTPNIELRPAEPGKKYSPAETREHTQAIDQLLTQGHTENRIVQHMAETFHVGRARTRRLIERVRAEWLKTDAETRKHERSAQVRRLKRCIRDCKDPNTGKVLPKMDRAVHAYEELLAKIVGTNAPIEMNLNVQVSDALLGVINALDEDSVAAMLDEYYETKALAERARELKLGPATAEAG